MEKQQVQSPSEQVRPPVRLRRPDRSQVRMELTCPDELVGPDHQARVIWEVAGRLDLSAFAAPIKARDGVCGRDATDPRLLVSLWLYAATRGVGSARELARLCGREGEAGFRWLCGGVSVNHHTLSDFRVAHADALDALFTRVLASLVEQGLVTVERISQDGTRVRACAGASSFRREQTLQELLAEAGEHVKELRRRLDDPALSAELSARQRVARERAARERQQRVEAAVGRMAELKRKHAAAAERAGDGEVGRKIREKQPRASTTDPEASVMRMPDGGFRPAVNVQLATDTKSRAVVGLDVTGEGSDSAGLSEPMRKQVESRTGGKVREHLVDGGYLRTDDIERAHAEDVALFVPPKPAKAAGNRGRELEPKGGDTEAVLAWKRRMSGDEGKEVYKERAATSETVNADLKAHRGLVQLTVRGLAKARCVALWCALAYNLLHFGRHLLA